ncbi:MAG: hypothetical protein K2H61_01270 [Muribaculaceae bacterium]|nr:hypothetical protein [Muribaculaceae bacterium]
MKRFIYLLALVVPFLALTSCESDDKFPDVDITVNFDGPTRVGNTLYVVQGEPLTISSITMVDHTPKGAVIGSATYFWDYYNLGGTIQRPYGFTIDTTGVALGNHWLQISVTIYAVDYAPCIGYLEYKVVVVPSADDIPSDSDSEINPSLGVDITDYTSNPNE